MISIAKARTDFAATENWVYLDSASTGIMPR